MIVGGFPTKENPARCVFNYRAALDLGDLCELKVIFFRMWRPRRKILSVVSNENFSLITISLPGYPKLPHWNYFVFKYLGSQVLKKILRNSDIIHSVGGNFIGVVSSFFAKKFKLPHIAQLIGSDINSALPVEKDRIYIKGWENWISGISANSHAIVHQFQLVYPKISIPSIVNYRGVDLNQFKPKIKNSNGLQLMFIGGLPHYPNLPFKDNTKGGRTLMEVWSMLDEKINLTESKLLFAGPGSDDSTVEDWKSSLKQPKQVEIVGPCDPKNVVKLMSESHIVLIPSKEEGTPNACFEGMASGCAIFGSNVGGIPELVDDGINGKVISVNKPADWVSAISWAIENRMEISKMGSNARTKAVADFDHKYFSDRLIDFYSETLENKRNHT